MNRARRGAPLMFLGAVVSGWVAARVMTYSPLWVGHPPQAPLASPERPFPNEPRRAIPARLHGLAVPAQPVLASDIQNGPVALEWSVLRPELGKRAHEPLPSSPTTRFAGQISDRPVVAVRPLLGRVSPRSAEQPAPDGNVRPSRWSGDGWLLLRRGSSAPLLLGDPGYGRSQAGAVLRYGLAPSSGHRPQAHLRASAALAGPRERELAGGLSARPIVRVPLRFAGELRVSETGSGTELRPAAYVVTEFPPVKLPIGTQGEVYLQGGYVGGRFATAFVDGQARLERPLAEADDLSLRVGVGAWGGAQDGASRLDVGPTAAVTFRLGELSGRLAADYRLRIAGDAEPASGPALTVSAGF